MASVYERERNMSWDANSCKESSKEAVFMLLSSTHSRRHCVTKYNYFFHQLDTETRIVVRLTRSIETEV